MSERETFIFEGISSPDRRSIWTIYYNPKAELPYECIGIDGVEIQPHRGFLTEQAASAFCNEACGLEGAK